MIIYKEKLEDIKKGIIAINYDARHKSVESIPSPSRIFKKGNTSNTDSKRISSPLINFVPIKHTPSLNKKSFNLSIQPFNNFKLFEDFFIIGIQKKDLIEFENNNENAKFGVLSPKYLYSFKKNDENSFIFTII